MNKTQAELLISNFIIDHNGDNSIKEAWALIRTQKSNKPKMPDKPELGYCKKVRTRRS
jgi:hypothetical protein